MDSIQPSELVTNVNLPRNPKFTGRDEILTRLHAYLEDRSGQHQGEDGAHEGSKTSGNHAIRSCLIHGLGGLGKTETAREYTYKYRRSYTHVFWLPSENQGLLQEAFHGILATLPIPLKTPDTFSVAKKVEMVLEWLQSTDRKWLLVFDNCEDPSLLRGFWPAGGQGAIIVTSQNPLLGQVTNNSIALPPMPPTQGKELIQNYLNRGSLEQEEAEKLSHSLGGLPLAIVHFAGYIARTQRSIQEINQDMQQQLHTNEIWKSSNDITHPDIPAYQHTLNTVWDHALDKLTPDARFLLDLLAILDPDQVPLSLFIGKQEPVPETGGDGAEWQYWPLNRFNAAIGSLNERHLIERYQQAGVRTHRALQRSILLRLNEDISLRNERFAELVAILRKAVPSFNVLKRNDATQYPAFAECLPQVTAFHGHFAQMKPPIKGTLELVSVLTDISYYTFAQENPELCEPFINTAEAICQELRESIPEQALSMRAGILALKHTYTVGWGPEGRQVAIGMTAEAVGIRKQEKSRLAEGSLTDTQAVNYARALADHACCLCHADRIDEAAPLFKEAIAVFAGIGNTLREAHCTIFSLYIHSARKKVSETRKLGKSALAEIIANSGNENPIITPAKFRVAQALYVIGDVHEAYELHKEVFEKRTVIFGDFYHSTLASRYCLGVCQQQLGMLEDAESSFRGILGRDKPDRDWRAEDIARAKLQLSIVLEGRNQPVESKRLRSEVLDFLNEANKESEVTDASLLQKLDHLVALHHGRTTGIWSNGKL